MISEKEKYIKVWGHKEYSSNSPGAREAVHAIQTLGIPDHADINLYGCGSGKEMAELNKFLKEPEFNAIDIAPNCMLDEIKSDKNITFTFYEADLCDMIEVPEMSYGFCVDVMEHIDPNLVEVTLQRIAEKTRLSCYFSIALFEDTWYTEKLHLTVKSPTWWNEQISKHFNITYMSNDSNHVRIVGEKYGKSK